MGAGPRKLGQIVKRLDTPFPRHWLGYIVLKLAILVIAVAGALKYFGFW
jgi:hypothetical protein